MKERDCKCMRGIRTEPVPICPKCRAQMVLRKCSPDAVTQWPPFWGCPRYPVCHGTRNIQEDGLPEEDDFGIDEFIYGRDAWGNRDG